MAVDTSWVGQCTYWVWENLAWLRGKVSGNADNWASSAAASGLTVTRTPSVGSAVVWGPGNGYSDVGHVAVVTAVDRASGAFTVSEMNYKGWDQVDTRVVPSYNGILGFIHPPGMQGLGPGLSTIEASAGSSTSDPGLPGLSSGTVTQPNGSVFGIHGGQCYSLAEVMQIGDTSGGASGAAGVTSEFFTWLTQPCKWITWGLVIVGGILVFKGLGALTDGRSTQILMAPVHAGEKAAKEGAAVA